MKQKKTLYVSIAIIVLIIVSLLCIGSIILYSKPSVTFMLVMNEIVPAWGVTAKEADLALTNGQTKMTIYTRIINSKKDRYYFCLHGLTPQGYTHPSLVTLAKALALATGRRVLVPYLKGSETTRDILDATNEVASMYCQVRKNYPGKYNGFGACISATMLVGALRNVPLALYPDKLFLYGPFLNGEMLMHFYNTAGQDVDFIVKLANAMRHAKTTEDEKKLISQAIVATKPGKTNKDEMKKILGIELYTKVDTLKIENPEFKAINELTLFNAKKPLPQCKYYILHSKSDNIIPYSMGVSLHKYLLQLGLTSTFVATGTFQHTQTQKSIKTLYNEYKEIKSFFDDLFSDDENAKGMH